MGTNMMGTNGIAAQDYGGNIARTLGAALEPERSADAPGLTLANGAYRYEILTMIPGEVIHRIGLSSAALWTVSGELQVATETDQGTAPAGHAALIEADGLRIENNGAAVAVALLAGVAEVNGSPSHEGVVVRTPGQLKRVEKPWGEEVWINGRHPGFAFKRIVLRAGRRTSLQYHEFKRETNLLVSGTARLHHAAEAGRHDGPIEAVDVGPVTAIDVSPPVLHRIEAVTDVTLFEVSTPHLDDVIRVSDDTDRADGLISSEHARPERSVAPEPNAAARTNAA